jgi:hypothetical protein
MLTMTAQEQQMTSSTDKEVTMAETKDNTKELEKQLKEAQDEIKKLTDIANGYFKAYRNLLGQLNITVQTQQDIDAALQEKLK